MACWQNVVISDFTAWLRLARVALSAADVPLTDRLCSNAFIGGGSRPASALARFGTSDGGGALPPCTAVSVALSCV